MSTDANQQERETVKINTKPIEFNAHAQTKYLTSNEMERMFNKYFRAFLADYEGCIITPVVGDIVRNEVRIDLAVYLTNKPTGAGSNKIKTLSPVDKAVNPKSSPVVRALSMNNRVKSNVYSIEEESKAIFEKWAYGNKWNDKTMAVQQVDPANRNLILVKIIGLDPVKIIEEIYGRRVDDEDFTYKLSPVKTIGPNNYMLRIERLNKENAEDFLRKMGFVPSTMGSIPINRE